MANCADKYEALPKDERPPTGPKQVRLRIEDATVEAVQGVLLDSPEGVLCIQDELSGFFGRMDAYSGARGASKDRAFWLTSFNGGDYNVLRVARGSLMIENLSVTLLGGIQPDAIRKVAADCLDDGLLQRLFPVVLREAALGEDEPIPPVASDYQKLVEALHQLRPPAGEGGVAWRLQFDEGAHAIRRALEGKNLTLLGVESINKKLAAHIGKLDGLFARLCVIWHCVEHAHARALPQLVTEATARRVGDFMQRYLLRHAFAFYSGTLALADDHDRLCNLASYILAHKLKFVTNRHLARGDRTMRKIAGPDVQRVFEQLEALGWVERTPGARPSDPLAWVVNPRCHTLFGDRAEKEAERRKKAKALLGDAFKRGED